MPRLAELPQVGEVISMNYPPSGLRAAVAGAVLSALLAACGGGGGGGTGSAAGTTSSTDVDGRAGPVDFAAACSNCGALDATTYAGSGVGIWEKRNTTGASVDVPVSISGLAGQDVTLVFTNETGTDTAFPAINNATQSRQDLLSQDVRSSQAVVREAGDPHAEIREFNRKGWADRLQPEMSIRRSLVAAAPQAAMYAVGATRNFYHQDQTSRTTTLQKQMTTTDGIQVNIWVESSEVGAAKVTATMADQLATSFARAGGIYDMVRTIGGPLWGPHNVAGLISGTGQAIDVVVLNFDHNQTAFGTVGFFWSLHQLARSADSRSNESLSLYLDSETLYLGGDRGAKMVRMTLAHEAMHMSNFYRRGVLMGQSYQYDTWLEEMTAMMMEDAAASAIDPTFSPTRNVRLPDYLDYGSYNCALRDWTPFASTCESYAISGSLGGFLLRQLGVGFFQNLLNQRQASSEAALNSAIQAARPGSGLGEQLRHFAASAIGLLPAAAPSSFGFPARNEAGFDIPAVDASQFNSVRTLPPASPATLRAYGNFPVVRRAVRGTFAETVRVPPGTTLSVVIR
jgi:hypothetical protein